MGIRGKRGAAAALAVIAAFALAWWAKPYVIHWIASTIVEAQVPAVGRPAPDFHLPDVNGVTVIEYSALPENGERLVGFAGIREGLGADGNGEKRPMPAELPDREWRADPTDGLRPMKSLRAIWSPAP